MFAIIKYSVWPAGVLQTLNGFEKPVGYCMDLHMLTVCIELITTC